MISSRFKFIFIHVPKTGGNSVQDALRHYADDSLVALYPHQDTVERFEVRNTVYPGLMKHSTMYDYKNAVGKEISSYQIFTTIRNPFERLMSFYFSPHRGRVDWDADSFRTLIMSVPAFSIYVDGAPICPVGLSASKNSIQFLRFETLQDDFAAMCRSVGLPVTVLPHRNRSAVVRDYRDFFDDELISWVTKHHELEMSLGKYTF